MTTSVCGSFVASGRWEAVRRSTPTVPALLEARCSARIALSDGRGRSISYQALRDEVAARSAYLARHLGEERSVVAVSLAEPCDMALTLLAVTPGHIALPLNPTLRSADAGALLTATRARVLLVDAATPRKLVEAARYNGVPVVSLDRQALPAHSGSLPPARPDDVALLLPTSGTTGRPELVTLSHGNVISGAAASAFAYALGPADVRLNVMPLHHVQGIVGALMAALVSGGATVCCRFSPRDTLTQLRETGSTWFSASPTMHRAILAALHGPAAGLRLRFVRCGSAALPGDLAAKLRDAWSVPVLESYGLTEAHQVASTPLDGEPSGNGAIGPPIGADVAVDGESQLWLRGPVVASREVASAEFTSEQAKLLTAGWLPTGDLGGFDADGSVRVHGRIKEMINCGGEKIAPFEVEEVLRTHPGVEDVVVFGVPDPTYGDAVACLVVPRASARLDAADLRTHVLERLAPVKCPRWVHLTRAIAVGPSGKVVRGHLAEQFQSGRL